MSSACRTGMLCLLLTATLLPGCASHYHHTQQQIHQAHTELNSLRTAQQDYTPPVRSHAGYFIQPTGIPLHHTPSWLLRPVEIHAEQLPLATLLTHLLQDDNLSVELDPSVNATLPVTLHYRGALAGALRHLRATTHYHFYASEQILHVSAFETKTFDISFLPGAATYRVGQDADSSARPTTDTTSTLDDQQFSNLHGSLSLWQDLENTLNQLKSPQGKITVSESTTSVTISDHPSALRAMARYIARLNRQLSQQVAIKVQVLEVNLNDNSQLGLNWALVASHLGGRWSLSNAAGGATSLLAMPLSGTDSQGSLSQVGFHHGQNDALLNAINQQGNVRVITEPEVTTLNNQIAAIRITQKIGYIESVSRTESQFANTSAINPGSVIDGFTLYLLPKIQADQVFLQISSTMANLERLDKVSTAPTELNRREAQYGQYQAIQVPTVSQKSFNQRSLIPSGATLIVAGYQQLQDHTHQASFFGVDTLGSKAADTHRSELLVLITPVILTSKHSHDRYHTP